MTHRAPLILRPYCPHWPVAFASERALIASALPSERVAIEHIGSTAVPGLAAKPIIDIMLGAASLAEIEAWVPILAGLGYEYMPTHEQAMPERRFFAKPLIRPRHFHVHGVVIGEAFWVEHLAFRDALRGDPELASRYAQLKHALAQQHGEDRERYTQDKGPFILSVLRNLPHSPQK